MREVGDSLPACPPESQLDALATDELPQSLAERVRAHVAGCEACGARLQLFEDVQALGARLREGQKSLPPLLRHGLLTTAHATVRRCQEEV